MFFKLYIFILLLLFQKSKSLHTKYLNIITYIPNHYILNFISYYLIMKGGRDGGRQGGREAGREAGSEGGTREGGRARERGASE